jgi:hypothetical protein
VGRPGTLVELQQSAGNVAVGRLIARATLARKGKKAAPPPQRFSVAPNDGLFLDADGDTVRVGTAATDGAWVAVDAKGQRAIGLDDAVIGTVSPGPGGTPDALILRARRATVTQTPASPGDAGGTPADVKLTGTVQGVIFDPGTAHFGPPLLAGGKDGWTPVAFAKLPESLRGALTSVPEAHPPLEDGGFWALMSFHLKDETADTTRWVPAKEEVKQRRESLEKDAEKLPDDVRRRFGEYLGVVTAVMSVEGTYGSKSPEDDTAASIGIFQWAMNKSGAQGAGSSMGVFFKDLKRRAEAAAPKAGQTPTAEQQLYIDAWEQCRKAGIDVDAAGTVTLNGKATTGGDVEDAMAGSSGPMAQGALKTYQLVAAMDWIETFRGTLVRPGPNGAPKIGHEYAERGNGTSVTMTTTHGGVKYTFTLDAPDITATVGDILTTGKDTALAVTLGVNRPHFVETALWLAVGKRANPKADADAILTRLVVALEGAEAAPAEGGKKPKKPKARTIRAGDVQALGGGAAADWEELRRLIWPAPLELDADAEEKLATEFKRQALLLYKASDARKYHRERRFATAEAAF